LPVYRFALFAGSGAQHFTVAFFLQYLSPVGPAKRQKIKMIAAGQLERADRLPPGVRGQRRAAKALLPVAWQIALRFDDQQRRAEPMQAGWQQIGRHTGIEGDGKADARVPVVGVKLPGGELGQFYLCPSIELAVR
jgi:hypothetical protein